MLLYVSVSIVIILVTLVLHYRNHFKLSIWKRSSRNYLRSHSSKYSTTLNKQRLNRLSSKSPIPSPMMTPGHAVKTKCICKITSIEGEQFNFFPMAFLFYIVFMLFLCILVLITELINTTRYPTEIYSFTLTSYHLNSLNSINTLNLRHKTELIIYIFDYILIYALLILLIWESLFSFYRYYTTLKSAVSLQVISTQSVLLRFILYPILFAIAYLLQIYVWYYLFPVVILLHATFNLYWTLQFASLLTERYQLFADMSSPTDILGQSSDQDLLESVRFMTKTSLICCILQSFYLSLFVITYNVETLYLLPIFWSVSSCIFSSNFIRNRKCIYGQYAKVKSIFANNDSNVVAKCNKKCMQIHIHGTSRSTAIPNEIVSVINYEVNSDKKNRETKSNYTVSTLKPFEDLFADTKISQSKSNPIKGLLHRSLSLKANAASAPTQFDEIPDESPTDDARNGTETKQFGNGLSTTSDIYKEENAKQMEEHDHEQNETVLLMDYNNETQSDTDRNESGIGYNEVPVKNTDETDDESLNDNAPLDDAVKSFNILVSFGFCAKLGTESIDQMTKYYDEFKSHKLTGHAHTIHGNGRNIGISNKLKIRKEIQKSNTISNKSILKLFNYKI